MCAVGCVHWSCSDVRLCWSDPQPRSLSPLIRSRGKQRDSLKHGGVCAHRGRYNRQLAMCRIEDRGTGKASVLITAISNKQCFCFLSLSLSLSSHTPLTPSFFFFCVYVSFCSLFVYFSAFPLFMFVFETLSLIRSATMHSGILSGIGGDQKWR